MHVTKDLTNPCLFMVFDVTKYKITENQFEKLV